MFSTNISIILDQQEVCMETLEDIDKVIAFLQCLRGIRASIRPAAEVFQCMPPWPDGRRKRNGQKSDDEVRILNLAAQGNRPKKIALFLGVPRLRVYQVINNQTRRRKTSEKGDRETSA